jgi:hypothetical protein
MIKGTDNILKWFAQQNCGYWKIYPQGASRDKYIFDSGDDENPSIEASKERLSDCLSLLSQGRYFIQAKKKSSDSKGFGEIAYEHEGVQAGHNMNANIALPAISGISKSELQEEIAKAIENERTRAKMELLEKENAELKKEVRELAGNGAAAVAGRIFERAEPFIGQILNSVLPPVPKPSMVAAVGYAGDTQQQNTETTMSDYKRPLTPPTTTEEGQKRLSEALIAWNEKDPNRMLLIIEKITETAYLDLPTYEFYAGALLK